MFSAGHDTGSKQAIAEWTPGPRAAPQLRINGGTRQGAEKLYLQEWHYFFQNTKRWRDLRKITIAQVHGNVISAGLMLTWACDLIVAAEDTQFSDVVGQRLGMCGVEYFAHPWEFGPRKTKELMLTGDSIDAEEAHASAWSARSTRRTSSPTGPWPSPAGSPRCPPWPRCWSRSRSTRPWTRWASPTR